MSKGPVSDVPFSSPVDNGFDGGILTVTLTPLKSGGVEGGVVQETRKFTPS